MKTCLVLICGVVLVFSAFASVGLAQTGGEATYKAKCQMCHGETGLGDTSAGKTMKVKSFKDPETSKMSETALLNIIKNGHGKMPAYKDKLTDEQIKEVVTYIEKNFMGR